MPLNGDHGFMPAWLVAVLRVGVPSAIALYLVYSLVTLQATDVRTIRDQVNRNATQEDQIQGQVDELYQRQEQYLGTLLAIEQRVCLNTANDGVERQACLEPEPLPPPKKVGK